MRRVNPVQHTTLHARNVSVIQKLHLKHRASAFHVHFHFFTMSRTKHAKNVHSINNSIHNLRDANVQIHFHMKRLKLVLAAIFPTISITHQKNVNPVPRIKSIILKKTIAGDAHKARRFWWIKSAPSVQAITLILTYQYKIVHNVHSSKSTTKTLNSVNALHRKNILTENNVSLASIQNSSISLKKPANIVLTNKFMM